MRTIYIVLLSLLSLTGVVACQPLVEEAEEGKKEKGLLVNFNIDVPEVRATRAVPNGPTGTEANADYESAYKNVAILFYDSNGNLATVRGKHFNFFETAGLKPQGEERKNWVGGVYERADNGGFARGVYLVGVTRDDVRGKTCVVMLNIPDDLRDRLQNRRIQTLGGLENHILNTITSADEQIGPIPYPVDANNRPDIASDDFRHIVMIGKTPNVQFDANELQAKISVDMKRTIAKVRLVIRFNLLNIVLGQTNPSPFVAECQFRNFPKLTKVGEVWKPESTPENQRVALMSGDVVQGSRKENRIKVLTGAPNVAYLAFDFYMNEYGVLPEKTNKNQRFSVPGMKMKMVLPFWGERYWELLFPRSIQRNKSYELFYTIEGKGNSSTDNFNVTLVADNIVVLPWSKFPESFHPGENYNFNNFIGNPDNSTDQI
jgi:lipoprotein